MEHVKCGIVKDLLPSYQEGVASNTTSEMIEDHLKTCENCRNYQAQIIEQWKLEEEEELTKGKLFQQKLMSYRYPVLGFLVGLLAPFALILIKILLGLAEIYMYAWFL